MDKSNKAVIWWLYACAASVVAMMFIGALTRLTESGLSIAVWEPFKGALPPVTEEEWQRYFDIYKTTPEFVMINNWMSLEHFKGIFWLEYLHRLWGRIIGGIFLIPMFYFYMSKRISGKFALKMLGIFALGGLQGFIGWFMVHSGLEKSFSVSHYRLALHLLVALLIYGLLIWTAFNLKNNTKEKSPLAMWSKIFLGMVIFMVVLGAFVAGKDAGFAYNTFPLMDGRFFPKGAYKMDPWYMNHLENGIMIQFQHRLFAYILTIAALAFAVALVKRKNYSDATWLISALALQIAIGISTLIAFGRYADFGENLAYHKVTNLPVILGAVHQLGAVILFTVSLKLVHKTQRA